jgi:glucosamine 6-phosphate synthetase-like amidotransferase/phosphosugar isomerase protein
MKITLNVTEKELDMLEEYITCWLLCNKHKKEYLHSSDEEIYQIQHSCKACMKIRMKNYRNALHLWSRLCDAYEQGENL